MTVQHMAAVKRGYAAPYQNPIADRIARWCFERAVTMKALGERGGLSRGGVPGVLKMLEEGTGNVGRETLRAIANSMGKTLRWLEYGKDEPFIERIVDWCEASEVSFKTLCETAGVGPAVLRQLEEGDAAIGLPERAALAKAMGKTLKWLEYGDEPPPGVYLRDLPGWAAAAEEAVSRLDVAPELVEAMATWKVHDRPARIDALAIAALARALPWERPRDASRRKGGT